MNIYGIDINFVIPLFGAFLRIFFLLIFMPFFSSKIIPFPVKWMLSVCLLFTSFSVLELQIGVLNFSTSGEILVFFLKESLVGLILGFSAKLIFEGILLACHFIGSHIGFETSNYYDDNGNQIASVSQFIFILATIVFLSIDMHHFMIRAVVDSFSILPLGKAVFSVEVFEHLSLMGTKFFWMLIQFAAPIAIFLFIINISFGILSKMVPQLNALIINLSLNIPFVLLVFLVTILSFEVNIKYISKEALKELFEVAGILNG